MPIIEKQRALPVKGKVYFVQRPRVCDVCWLYNIAKRYSQQIWAEACGGTEQAVAAYTLLYDVMKSSTFAIAKDIRNFIFQSKQP